MRLRLFTAIAFFPVLLYGQEVLNDYVRYGIENNLSLQQKQSGYQKSIEALKEARGLFYPNISFIARYSVAQGGRLIDFPIGDLLNPVYTTLNTLTSSNKFSMVENQQIMFMRPLEQETKIRIVQPVLNKDIYYNSLIKKELSVFDENDFEQYKRELVAEIKKSYYNVIMSESVLSMLLNTRKLLQENVRVNKRLVENDKITLDYLYRSETELSKFEQDVQKAEKGKMIATAYFNFLLNRPLTDNIIIEQPVVFPVLLDLSCNFSQSAISNRELRWMKLLLKQERSGSFRFF